jgi:hypothetical protein
VINQVLTTAQESDINLRCHSLITEELIEQIRELNRVRNGFSHSAALSDQQSSELFVQCLPDVLSILKEIDSFEDVTLMRYAGSGENFHIIRCEIFRGSRLVREFEEITIDDQELSMSGRFLNRRAVLVKNQDRIYSLSPFVHFQEDEAGHQTKICFYKRASNNPDLENPPPQYEFEVIGTSQSIYVERAEFEEAMEELRELLQG